MPKDIKRSKDQDQEITPETVPQASQQVPPQIESLLDKIISRPTEDLIPWESVALPSCGVYYDGKIPNGIVEVKAWGIQTDKIMATTRLAQTGKSIDYVLKSCVRLPNDFDHMNLLVGDRTFLLYYLRGITYGNEYEFLIECSNEDCGNAWTEIYDLNDLASTIIKPKTELGPEPFKVVLPNFTKMVNSEFCIHIRLLRGYDLSAMMSQKRMQKKLNPSARTRARTHKAIVAKDESFDETVEENLRLVITDAMGDNDPDKIERLVERMHAVDTATIREFLRDNSPGIETSIKVTCPECNTQMTLDLPITESFFRPTQRKRIGE